MSAYERTSLVMLICSRISELRLDVLQQIKYPRLMLIKGDRP